MQTSTSNDLLRLKQVLKIIPVSRSSWYDGIQRGVYPASVRIGRRTAAWRRCDLVTLASRFGKVWDEHTLSHSSGEQA